MIESGAEAGSNAGIYRVADGVASLEIAGLQIVNGIAWSPSGDELYFADSARQIVYRTGFPVTDYESFGDEIFVELAEGAPDGAAADIAGRYWSAVWGQGRLHCYLPDGELLQSVELPTIQPTCLAFGGPDGNLLFVTSAREGLNEAELEQYPKSGSLFVFKTNTCGSRSFRYML